MGDTNYSQPERILQVGFLLNFRLTPPVSSQPMPFVRETLQPLTNSVHRLLQYLIHPAKLDKNIASKTAIYTVLSGIRDSPLLIGIGIKPLLIGDTS